MRILLLFVMIVAPVFAKHMERRSSQVSGNYHFSPPSYLYLSFVQAKGKKGWLCAQLPNSEYSLWYQPDKGWSSLANKKQECAPDYPSYVAPVTKPTPHFKEEDLTDYREIEGWPGWLCADFKDKRKGSVWYVKASGSKPGSYYEGDCDSWKRNPDRIDYHHDTE